jgi:uncharacterized protein
MTYSKLIVFSVAIIICASNVSAQTVGIGTTKAAFTNQAGQAIAKVVSQKTDLQMRAQPFGGSSVYVPAMNMGQIEFGLVNEFESLLAVTGRQIYKGRKHPNLRIATVLTPIRVAAFVRKNSEIKTLKDLKGKRVASGWASQRIIQPLVAAHFANAGFSYSDVVQVPAPNVIKAANDFQAGKTDVFFLVLGSGKVRETNAKVKGIRALPFDPSPDAMARARKHVPPVFPLKVKPAKPNVGIDKPMHVMTYFHTVATHAKVPNDVVYKVVKAMHDHKGELMKSFRAMALFNPKRMAKKFKGLAYHPGAIKYYKEIGQWPPK